MTDPQLPDMDVADRAFAERLQHIHAMNACPPEPTCIYCDTALVDLDMAEDEDGHQYGTGRCPNGDCEASLPGAR